MGSIASSFSGAVEDVIVEAYEGRDGQGAASYGTAVTISAVALSSDEVVRTGGGQEVMTSLALLVDGGEDYLPLRDDRVTTSEGSFIVVKREAVKTFSNVVDHVECACREA